MISNKTKIMIPFATMIASLAIIFLFPNFVTAENKMLPLKTGPNLTPFHFLQDTPTTSAEPRVKSRSGDLTEVGTYPVGPCYALASNGSNLLYAGNGRRLDIYDITIGSSPALLGSLVVPGFVNYIAVDGPTIFVCTPHGLVTVDASDTAAPVQTSRLLDDFWTTGVWVETGTVYVAARSGSVFKFDRSGDSLSNQVTGNPGGMCVDIIHHDGHVLVARLDGDAALLNETTLALIDDVVEIPEAENLTLDGNTLYVGYLFGMTAFDITDITAPEEMSSCDDGDSAGGNVTLYGNYAYHCIFGRVNVADISNPFSFSCSVGMDVPATSTYALCVGDYLYVGTNEGGMQTYSLTNPLLPTLEDAQQIHSYSYGLQFMGDYLFQVQNYAGIKTLDISDPIQPIEVGVYTPSNCTLNVLSMAGNTLFATNQYSPGFLALDATDPTALALQDTIDVAGAIYNMVDGDIAYVGSYIDGLCLIDVSNPDNLVRLGTLPGCAVYSIIKIGDLIYAADPSQGILVIDVSNTAAPTIVGTAGANVDSPYEVCLVPPYLYVADWVLGGIILDITTDPLAPSLVGSFGDPGLDVLSFTDDYLYSHTNEGNYALWDVIDPSSPNLLGEIPGTGYYCMKIISRSNLAYGSDFDCGIVIMENANIVSVYMPSATASWHGLEVLVNWQVPHQQPGTEYFVWRENTGLGRLPVSGNLTSDDGNFIFRDTDASITESPTSYWIQEVESDGSEFWFGPLELTGTPDLPTIAKLGMNSPNPFNPHTQIEFTLPQSEAVSIKVYDLAGRLVSTLFDGKGQAGNNHAIWDGTNDGKAMPSGVYLVRLVTESTMDSRKIVLAR